VVAAEQAASKAARVDVEGLVVAVPEALRVWMATVGCGEALVVA